MMLYGCPLPCELTRSEFFRGLLSCGLSEDGISEFTVTDTDRDTLTLLLEFLYTGRVQETPEHLGDHQVILISIPPSGTGTRGLSSKDSCVYTQFLVTPLTR